MVSRLLRTKATKHTKAAVIGLGYVGLPLAVELGTVLETIGYDIKQDRINDGMGAYVARQVIKLMIRRGHRVEGSHVLILGITFKENCPDIRNS